MWGTERMRAVRWILAGQAGMVCVVFLVGWFFGPLNGKSAALGGLICFIPTCWFALRAFRHAGARSATNIVRSLYAGAAGKMVMTVVLFGFLFAYVKPINAVAVFAGFAGVSVMNWLGPIFVARLDSKRNRTEN